MGDEVRTRFAPSPTGALHVGGARIALLNALCARKWGGRFSLRFEDTDAARSRIEFARAIEEDLAWLGVVPDEIGFQSRRFLAHRASLEALAEQGLAYRCFCSAKQLERDRALARAAGRPPRYAARCRALSPDEAKMRAEKGEAFVWRLAAHAEEGKVRWREMDGTEIEIPRSAMDDPVLVRSDGSFTFLLPNAIDDADEGISHVIRGEDQRTNTAYQLVILQALGKSVPLYQHVGLIVDAHGRKLSKRHGASTIAELRKEGWEPEAIVQYLVRIGHPNLDERVLDFDELAKAFLPDRLSRAPAKWQKEAIAHWNAIVLHTLPEQALARRLARLLPAQARPKAAEIASLLRENLSRLSDVLAYARLWDAHAPLSEEAKQCVRQAPWLKDACAWLDEENDLSRWLEKVQQRLQQKGGRVLRPLRAAILGHLKGPPLKAVLAFLGRKGVRKRLADALEQAEC